MNSHQPSSTEPLRIVPAYRPSPWKKVIITGSVSAAAFVFTAALAMIDGATGIPLRYVAVYFGWLFMLSAILTVILVVLAGCQSFLASDRHKNAKWKADRA